MLFAAVLFSFVACVDRSDPTAPGASNTPSSPVSGNVASVNVKLPATSLEVGQAANAAATAMNSAGQPIQSDTIEWSSSDTSILAVSNTGVLTARKMGSANVWAKSHGVSGKGSLTVTDSMPASVVVSPASAAAAVGATVQLSASVTTRTGRPLPGHAVKWASTDARYVTVSPTGLATGKLKGSAKIVATASKAAGTADVSVAAAHIAALSVVPHAATISSGSKLSLTANALDSQGNSLSGRAVSWTTSNSNIATISTTGVVTAAKIGYTTITATSEGVTAASRVHVTTGGVALVTITPGSIGLVTGATQPLAVTLSDAAGNALPSATMKWSSSNNNIAGVSTSGVVTAKRTGGATIYASVNGVSGQAAVAVSAAGIKSIAVSPSSFTLVTSGTRQLSASLTDASGNAVTGQTIAWSSSNSSIAAVSSSGMVTAMHSGNANITAAAGGASANAAVTVSAGTVSTVSVSPGSASLVAGSTQQFVANLTDNTGSAVSGQTITWKSSDASIVSVSSSGVATAAHTGSAVVTATTGAVSGQSTVTVSAGALSNVTITPASGTVQQGNTMQLAASFTDVAGNPVPATSLSWTSSNTADATVTGAGLVTGMGAGTANVTATANGKSKSAPITVTATAPPTLSSLTLSPASATLAAGATQSFTVAGTWSSGSTTAPAVTYSATGGSITSSGVYTAGTTAGTFRVVATSGSKSDSSVVTITAPAAPTLTKLTLSPVSVSLAASAKQTFTVAGTWSNGSTSAPAATFTATGGAITSAGVYTAGTTAGTFRVVATSGTKADTAVVTIATAVKVAPTLTKMTLSPASATLAPNATVQLSVAGVWSDGSTAAPPVTYAATGGSVSSGGLYTAGGTTGTYRVVATATGYPLADTSVITIANATVVATSCDAYPHTRAVPVSTSAQLHSALSGARPGDLITLADGTYGDGSEFHVTVPGSASARITLCGTANAIINAQSISNRDGIYAMGANYWTFSGFTITNALFGFYAEKSSHMVLEGLTVHGIGQEGVEIANFSKNALIRNNHIYDTGNTYAEYGEGIYIGSANAKWAALTGGVPDATDSVVIDGNHIGPDVRAEHIDVKEGTVGGEIKNNTFDGRGMIESQGTGISGWPNSWVIIQGDGYHIHNNNGSTAIGAGFRVVTHGTVATGQNNSFSSNVANVGGAPYGFLIQTGSSTDGNAVMCSNTVSGASSGLANVSCQ